MSALERLKKRRDFLRTQRFGSRAHGSGLVLIASKAHPKSPSEQLRVGFTVPKAVGKAHVRNLVKRRLKHVAHLFQNRMGLLDIVVLAKPPAAQMSFAQLSHEFSNLLVKLKTTRMAAYKGRPDGA